MSSIYIDLDKTSNNKIEELLNLLESYGLKVGNIDGRSYLEFFTSASPTIYVIKHGGYLFKESKLVYVDTFIDTVREMIVLGNKIRGLIYYGD